MIHRLCHVFLCTPAPRHLACPPFHSQPPLAYRGHLERTVALNGRCILITNAPLLFLQPQLNSSYHNKNICGSPPHRGQLKMSSSRACRLLPLMPWPAHEIGFVAVRRSVAMCICNHAYPSLSYRLGRGLQNNVHLAGRQTTCVHHQSKQSVAQTSAAHLAGGASADEVHLSWEGHALAPAINEGVIANTARLSAHVCTQQSFLRVSRDAWKGREPKQASTTGAPLPPRLTPR